MRLSRREYQVAKFVAWGASDKEVAAELGISWETAKTHRRNILRKIGGHNAADLARWFFQYKSGISFGMNPRQIRHLACWLLLLVGVAEYNHGDTLRTFPARVVRASRSGRGKREQDNALNLIAA